MKSRKYGGRGRKDETHAEDNARHSSPILGSLQLSRDVYRKSNGQVGGKRELSAKLNTNRSSDSSDITLPGHCLHTDSGISSSDSLVGGEKGCDLAAEQDFVSELMKIADTKLSGVTTRRKDTLWDEVSDVLGASKQILPSSASRRHGIVLPVLGSAANNEVASSIFMTAMDADIPTPGDEDYVTGSHRVCERNVQKQSETDIDRDDARLYCSSCGDILDEPRLLPCLHTFCTGCLQAKVVQNKGTNADSAQNSGDEMPSESLACPTCSAKVDLSLEGVYGLPPNHMIQRLLLLHNLRSGKAIELTCDLCPESSSIEAHCVQCGVNMCQFCFQAHKRQSLTTSHTVILVAEDDAEGQKPSLSSYKSRKLGASIICQRHTSEELRLYCMDCSQLVCRDCCLGSKHRDHKFEYLDRVIEQKVSEIAKEITPCEAKIKSLQRAISSLEQSEKIIDETTEEIVGKVERHIASYIQSLQKHKHALLSSVKVKANSKKESVMAQKNNLAKILKDASHSCDFTSQLLKLGSSPEILSMKPYVLQRLRDLSDIPFTENPSPVDNFLEFKANKKVKTWIDGDVLSGLTDNKRSSKLLRPGLEVDICGDVVSHALEAMNCTAHGEGVHCSRVKLPSEFVITAKNFESEKLEAGGCDVSVSITMKDVDPNLFKKPKVKITDRQDGTYRVLYMVYTAGKYNLNVRMNGEQIRDSPFQIAAIDAKAHVHSGIFHCCCFCSSGGDKNSTCGCGSIMSDGYKGCGHGHEGHPGTAHWSCCGQTTEASPCRKLQSPTSLHSKVPASLPFQYSHIGQQSHTLPTRRNVARDLPREASVGDGVYSTSGTSRSQRGTFQSTQCYNRQQSAPTPLTKQVKTVTL